MVKRLEAAHATALGNFPLFCSELGEYFIRDFAGADAAVNGKID